MTFHPASEPTSTFDLAKEGAQPSPPPWYASLPSPKSIPSTISPSELLNKLRPSKKTSGKDILVIDLRRTDCEGGTIKGALNLPAQSFYHTIPTLHMFCRTAGVEEIVFYCSSSRGRGPRAAGWFADHISSSSSSLEIVTGTEVKKMKSLVLEKGVKGWVAGGTEFTEHMDGFDAGFWNPKD